MSFHPFSKRSRDKPSPKNSVSEAATFFFGTGSSGKTATPRTAMQVSAVYACVRVISETIASLPLHLYRYTDAGSEKVYNNPLYRIVHDEPNSEMTSFVWREAMLAHLNLWGNHYSQIIRNGRGEVVALYPLLPDKMTVDRDARGALTYTYKTNGVDRMLDPSAVLHIPALGFDGVMGYSPIALERNAISLGIAAEEYGSKFFANGANPSGVLTHPSAVKDIDALRQSWNAVYGGSQNSGKVAVLEEGMKFEKVSIPNNDAQFIETRKFQISEIARIYRVPPHMIGDLEHATFSNIEHQSISFAQHTIRPWAVRIEQAMNRALLTPEQKQTMFFGINIDGLQRGAYKERMDGYAQGFQNGFLSVNDIRELENMNKSSEPNADKYMINGNMVPLDMAGAAYTNKQGGSK